MTEINEKYIQVRGKVATEETRAFGEDISVIVTVTSIEHQDNDDGTADVIYKCKLFGEE